MPVGVKEIRSIDPVMLYVDQDAPQLHARQDEVHQVSQGLQHGLDPVWSDLDKHTFQIQRGQIYVYIHATPRNIHLHARRGQVCEHGLNPVQYAGLVAAGQRVARRKRLLLRGTGVRRRRRQVGGSGGSKRGSLRSSGLTPSQNLLPCSRRACTFSTPLLLTAV